MTAGIVCEYNPFHNGHLYHIERTREKADGIVCVMSGNFVQRGECAFADKWTRAKTAVYCGADAVIDLPVPWTCASAETFARGSVGLLGAFGVKVLSFGSESEDIDLLKACADFGSGDETKAIILEAVSRGYSYPAALSLAAEKLLSKQAAEILAKPNSTLACEYIRAVKSQGLDMKLMAVKRFGADHDSNSTAEGFASASKIREMGICDGTRKLMPEVCYEMLRSPAIPFSMKWGERGILGALRDMPREDYALYIEDNRGLSDRIYEAARAVTSLDELYEKAKTKGYTLSRIRREVMSLYLRIPNTIREGIPPYIRVLAVSERGLSLLSEAKKKSTLPIVTKHSEIVKLDEKCRRVYSLQCSSSDKFALFAPTPLICGAEERSSIAIVR